MKLLLLVAGASLGLTVGLALRAWRASHTPGGLVLAGFDQAGFNANAIPTTGKLLKRPDPEDVSLAARLEHDLAISSGVTRWLYWLDALEKAAPADFPRLVKLAQGKPAAMRLVTQRWIELAPRQMFDTLVAAAGRDQGFPVRELAYELFRQWPKQDQQAAISALNEPTSLRDVWRHEVANAVILQDAERGLRLFSEWHIEHFGPWMTGVSKWAAADPRHAAEVALDYPSGYVSQLAVETVGKEWAKSDPAAAMEFATSKGNNLAAQLSAATLKEWAARDLDGAANWLAATDSRTRNVLCPSFLEAWAKKDADAALTWSQDNLTGTSLHHAVSGLIKGAADKNVSAAAAMVSDLEPSEARAEAASVVAHKWFPDLGDEKQVTPEKVTWLSGLDTASCKRVLQEIQWQWSTSDPKTMAAFLQTAGSDKVPTGADTVLAQQLARNDPLEALHWAGTLPEQRALDAGGSAFSEWFSTQPENALKWLDALSSDDARRQPFFKHAIQAMAYHPQAADQLAAMAGPDREAARAIVRDMSCPEDQRARLLQALAQSP